MRFLSLLIVLLVVSPTYAGDDWFSDKSSKDSWFSNKSKDHYFPKTNRNRDYYFQNKNRDYYFPKKESSPTPKAKSGKTVRGLNTYRSYRISNPNAADRFQFEGKTYFIPNHLRLHKTLELRVYGR